jgi:hypothetical protein
MWNPVYACTFLNEFNKRGAATQRHQREAGDIAQSGRSWSEKGGPARMSTTFAGALVESFVAMPGGTLRGGTGRREQSQRKETGGLGCLVGWIVASGMDEPTREDG